MPMASRLRLDAFNLLSWYASTSPISFVTPSMEWPSSVRTRTRNWGTSHLRVLGLASVHLARRYTDGSPHAMGTQLLQVAGAHAVAQRIGADLHWRAGPCALHRR